MEGLETILTRRSQPRLLEPAPDEQALERILQAGLCAPDHGLVRPWRFMVLAGSDREWLGEVFAEAALRDDPETSQAQLERLKSKPLRAPLVVLVMARTEAHPKAPAIEQKLAAGAAAQNMQLAAHALGYAAMWRTGAMAYHPWVRERLGLGEDDALLAYLYLGTAETEAKPRDDLDPWAFCEPVPKRGGEQ